MDWVKKTGTTPEPLEEPKAEALQTVLTLLLAHDDFLRDNGHKFPDLDIGKRLTINESMEKVVSKLLAQEPINERLPESLEPRLYELTRWSKENPAAVPSETFFEDIKSAILAAKKTKAFEPKEGLTVSMWR